MIYYRNRRKFVKKTVSKRLLSSFKGISCEGNDTNLPINAVEECYNFTMKNGKLEEGVGVAELRALDGERYKDCQFAINRIFSFPSKGKRQLLASCEGERAYQLNEEEKRWTIIPILGFSGEDGIQFTVDEKPAILIPKRDGGLYSFNGYKVDDLKVDSIKPTAMCAHFGRVFAVNKDDEFRIIFSDINDPRNWNISLDEGGQIYMDVEDGRILKLVSYGGHLYIFREYAIYRLTAYGDQRDFVMKKVLNTTAKIFKESIVLCDNRVLFLTRDGAYQFDGYSMSNIMSNYRDRIVNSTGTPVASFFDGKYYLAFCDGSDDGLNNILLVYDIDTRTITLSKGVKVKNFTIIKSMYDKEYLAVIGYNLKQVGIIINKSEYFGTPLKKEWIAPIIDFNLPEKEKEIEGIAVDEGDDYTLIVTVDGSNERRFRFDGRKRYVPVNMKGYKFGFSIEGTEKTDYVHSPYIYLKV